MTREDCDALEAFFITICKTSGDVPSHCDKCFANVDGAGCQHPLHPINHKEVVKWDSQ